MTKLAHVLHGAIDAFPAIDPAVAAEGLTLADCYHAGYLSACFDAPDGAAVGWTTADGGKTFAAPVAPAVDLRAYAAAARYARETAGITVGTAQIATDRDSQGMITGMWAAAQINPQIQVNFKSGSGFVVIGAAQVARIAAAVASYVQACFTAEAGVVAGIAAGTVKTAADVDAALAAVSSTFAGSAAAQGATGATGPTGGAGATGTSPSSGATGATGA